MSLHCEDSGSGQQHEVSVCSTSSIIALGSTQTHSLHVPRNLSAGIEED